MSARRQSELLTQNRLLVRQERRAERDLAALIKRMANRIADRVAYGEAEAALQIVDDERAAIAATLEKHLKQTALIFGGRTLERFARATAKSYYGGLPVGVGPVRGGAEDMRELKGAREVFEGAILAWVRRHALARAVTVTGTIKEAVRAALLDGVNDGTGEAGTVRLIRERIGRRLSATNAARIARTEMHTAATIGADEAARSTGLEVIKEWASAEDSRTRRSHAMADGQEVPLDDPFMVGGVRLMLPGDPNGPAKEIINCRCAILHHPVIGGVPIRETGRAPRPQAAIAPATNEERDEAARAYVLERGRAEGVEHISAYDAGTGKQFSTSSGVADKVSLPSDVMAALRTTGSRVVLHHNHPSSSSLSLTDVNFVVLDTLEAIHAHGHDGSSYAVRRGRLPVDHRTLKIAKIAAYEFLNVPFQAGQITAEDAALLDSHLPWLKLHRQGRLRYDYRLEGRLKAAVERHPDLIAAYLES